MRSELIVLLEILLYLKTLSKKSEIFEFLFYMPLQIIVKYLVQAIVLSLLQSQGVCVCCITSDLDKTSIGSADRSETWLLLWQENQWQISQLKIELENSVKMIAT